MSITVQISTKSEVKTVDVTDMNKQTTSRVWPISITENWYKLVIPCDRSDILDIKVDNESIQHCLNSGHNTEKGFEIWIHGNLATYFSRISKCFAQDDLLRFKNLTSKYLLTESWNEVITGDFVPVSVKKFFASGEGPHWYSLTDFYNLPYVQAKQTDVSKDINLEEDLTYQDSKFYGSGTCRSLQRQPVLPLTDVESLQNAGLQRTMQKFGFEQILQMQYVELQPNSVIPVHRDDFTYEDGRHIIDGPTQLYFVLTGDTNDVKFKLKNVGLIAVDKPIFINNHRFVHSLVYTGTKPRGVLLAYGISSLTNKKFIR